MTTILFGIKDTKSNLSFTKAKVVPNQLFLLSNPLFDDKEIMIKKSCINGNLNKLLNISSEKSTKKHRIFSDKDKNQSKKLKLTASTSALKTLKIPVATVATKIRKETFRTFLII